MPGYGDEVPLAEVPVSTRGVGDASGRLRDATAEHDLGRGDVLARPAAQVGVSDSILTGTSIVLDKRPRGWWSLSREEPIVAMARLREQQ